MEPELLFKICNTFVLLGWIILLFAPKWKYSQSIVHYGVILLLSLVYLFLILPTIVNFNPEAFSTLYNVKELFQDDTALTAGWIHYLAFDLFVGAYVVRDGLKHKLPRWQYTLPLPFTFMFGPIGLLLYLTFKLIKR